MIPLAAYAATRNRRSAPTLPFGWGAVTVLLVGAVLLIIGILMIIGGMFSFISGTVTNATSGNFSIGDFFGSFMGAMMLFIVGGILAGVGGWLVRLWWIFLLVGAVTASNNTADTAQGRVQSAPAPPEIKVRCRTCGHLNPQEARFCIACGQAV